MLLGWAVLLSGGGAGGWPSNSEDWNDQTRQAHSGSHILYEFSPIWPGVVEDIHLRKRGELLLCQRDLAINAVPQFEGGVQEDKLSRGVISRGSGEGEANFCHEESASLVTSRLTGQGQLKLGRLLGRPGRRDTAIEPDQPNVNNIDVGRNLPHRSQL